MVIETCPASPSTTLAPGASETMAFGPASAPGGMTGCSPSYANQAVGVLPSGEMVFANYCEDGGSPVIDAAHTLARHEGPG